ncbi:hypothetical protein ABT297_32380 [Dactylosporangium sp. NPDC000555]|uniref:hypothetical protein n=1 Tax=Dactylosporangium sp. NPDC000555 TaxID=3154260 RepID=UPI00332C2D8C
MVAIHYTGAGAAVRLGEVSRALTRAALAAMEAPSFHNTQPWRWHIDGERAELTADHRRRLPDDPDERQVTISCGAALHHALVVLAADGIGVEVDRCAQPRVPGPVAVLRYTGPAAREPRAERLRRAIAVRRTDRRTIADEPVPVATVRLLRAVAEDAGAHLHLLAGPEAAEATAPYARRAVITTAGDRPHDWLVAGEALSAVILNAAAEGLATSAEACPPTAVPPWLRRSLPPGAGCPAALVRFGVAGRIGAVPRPPLRPAAEVIEVVARDAF